MIGGEFIIMKILCVIPSRIASTRLPRKPLALIQGKPMIQRVYEAAVRCHDIYKVVVATDSTEIANVIHQVGGETVMTDANLATGSDRVAVAAERYLEAEVVINLQGDQPFIKPHMLTQLVKPYMNGEKPVMTTLACPVDIAVGYKSPDVVKVVVDNLQQALYFSRAPIPYMREAVSPEIRQHLGLYAYTREFLLFYRTLQQMPLELAESLEQLRVLEHGYKIRVCHTEHQILEINTAQELALAQSLPIE